MREDLKPIADYGADIIRRGDGWGALENYFNHKGIEAEDRQLIKDYLIRLEGEGLLLPPAQEKPAFDFYRDGMPYILVGLGALLALLLWGKGFVAILPFAMIGYGAYGIITKQS